MPEIDIDQPKRETRRKRPTELEYAIERIDAELAALTRVRGIIAEHLQEQRVTRRRKG